jgi:uncharacterized repeat protein (TIGR03806 family)
MPVWSSHPSHARRRARRASDQTVSRAALGLAALLAGALACSPNRAVPGSPAGAGDAAADGPAYGSAPDAGGSGGPAPLPPSPPAPASPPPAPGTPPPGPTPGATPPPPAPGTPPPAPGTPPPPAPPPPPAFACVNLPRPNDSYRLVDPFPNLPPFSVPTAAVQAPGQPEYWYVTEQSGRLKRFANRPDVTAATVVLDLSDRVDYEGDAGILAIAFHPEFRSNGRLFLSYTLGGSVLRSRLSSFESSNGGASFDPDSEEVLIEIEQPDPEKVHLNCDIHFGRDGFLWAAFGDGVDDDERSEAQSLGTLSGKMLRIDVDRRGDDDEPYAIPADNPFVDRSGARPEIWAYGFRNPWRWRFDPSDPTVIWAGEIGSSRREELDRVVKGGNYGWNIIEGTLCVDEGCNPAGTSAPVLEYIHRQGRSITAGPFYRGSKLPALRDRYIYGDFVSGAVWALPADRSPRPETILETGLGLVSFGEALDEELILVDYDNGRLHQVVPAAPEPAGALPTQLSATGCLVRPDAASGALHPYEVNSPLWSDGASKRRWMALPPGGKIAIDAEGDFQFPSGTTLVKEFAVGGTRVETRLFVRHPDGVWAGYSYGWNAEQTDATLVPPSSVEVKRTVGGVTWSHPTRWHCLACHTKEAGFALGPEIAQLNRSFNFPDGARNQLLQLERAGLLAAPLPAPTESLPALPDPHGAASLAARARSYLHANCAGCHRPRDGYEGRMDLRFTTSLAATLTCGVDSSFISFPDADQRIAPGDPARSVMVQFLRSQGEIRMPLVGTTVVDEPGVTLLESWIRTLGDCD